MSVYRLLHVGFSPELEHKLIARLVAKAAITDEDMPRAR
jgi:hypothetical protein